MLIELSEFNSSSVFSTSDWTNTITPLVVKPGGTLTFKGGFLDYATSSPVAIELPDDIEITIKVGFYMMAPYIESTDGTGPEFGSVYTENIPQYQGYDLYVARDSTTYDLITSTKTFTIQAGNYSPDEITEIINAQCVTVPQSLHGSGGNFTNTETSSFFRSTTLGMITCAIEPFPGTSWDSSPKKAVIQARDLNELAAFNVGDKIGLYDLTDGGTTDFTYNLTITAIDRTTGIVTVNPVQDRYQQTVLNMFMYKNIIGNPDNVENCVNFYRQATKLRPFDPTASFYFTPKEDRKTFMMGASQFQLEYDYNNNSLFQFTYLHTPFYDAGGENEAIQFKFAGYPFNNIFAYGNTATGVFFNDLQPRSFWEDILGFTWNDLTVRDNPTTRQLSAPLRTGLNITGNLVSNDALFDKKNAPLQQPPGEDGGSSAGAYRSLSVSAVSTQTTAIRALKTQGVTSSPFYLIEIGGLSDINMVNDTNLFRTICAFGSKEYSNQGIISIYADGTSFYTNNSPTDIIISSFRVRILDSLTKLTSTNLGPRNTIILELDNPIIQPIQQTDTKSKENKET
jgi:hypothetical protein